MALSLGNCHQHPNEKTTGKCRSCGHKICPRCQDSFGEFCSEKCMLAGPQANMPASAKGNLLAVPPFQQKKKNKQRQQSLALQKLVFKLTILVIMLILVGGAGYVIWVKLFDPLGEIKWEMTFESDQAYLGLLRAPNDRALFETEKAYQVINVSDGKKVKQIEAERSKNEQPLDPFSLTGVSKTVPFKGGFLVMDEKSVYTIASDWKINFRKQFDLAPDSFDISPNGQIWVGLCREQENEESNNYQFKLVCLDLTTGDELWMKPLKEGKQVVRLAVINDLVWAVITGPGKNHMPTYILAALNAQTGKNQWHQKLNSPPTWGPITHNNSIYFMADNQIYSFTQNGNPKWRDMNGKTRTIIFPDGTSPYLFIKDDILFADVGDETLAYSIRTGMGKWKVRIQFDESRTNIINNKVFITGFIRKRGKTYDLKKMSGFDQVPEVLEDMGLDTATVDTEIPVLLGLDKASGKVLWKIDQAYGTIISDDHRLLRIMKASDTQSGLLRNRPETFLFQYDINDGSVYFSKTFKEIDLLEPKIIGSYLVGYTIDTINQVRKKDPQTLTMYSAKTNVKGRLISFQLR